MARRSRANRDWPPWPPILASMANLSTHFKKKPKINFPFHGAIPHLFHSNIQSWQMHSPPTWDPYVFFTHIFLTIFLVKSKFSTAKKSKTAAFSRVFTQNHSTIFLGKLKLNYWTKNEDFEQCDEIQRHKFLKKL